jgi:chorismate synthase
VAAGAIAEKYLKLSHDIEITAFISSVGSEHLFYPTPSHPNPTMNPDPLNLINTINQRIMDSFLSIRCPDTAAAQQMMKLIEHFCYQKDSIGGTVTCIVRNIPVELGESCFNKLEAKLAYAMLSIPVTTALRLGLVSLATKYLVPFTIIHSSLLLRLHEAGWI